MNLKPITNKQKRIYNKAASHIMQSWEWGEFRKSLGTHLLRYGIYKNGMLASIFQLTLHPIPFTKKLIGYLPRGPIPDNDLAHALVQIARVQNCAFIKVEPNVEITNDQLPIISHQFIPSPKTYFTKYNFIIDLTQSEEELLKKMHPKTRYNIRLAQKKGVRVEERTDDEALEIYLKLYFETTKRQGFYGHNPDYHKKAWETMRKSNMARILIGFYQKKPLTAWMLLNFKDTLYYPYGGSLPVHREVMHSNLVAWEAIRVGKRLKLKSFDMWGAANSRDPDTSDSFYGFHNFKKGYGGKLVEYIGTFDLVFNKPVYFAATLIDKSTRLKVMLLKMVGG